MLYHPSHDLIKVTSKIAKFVFDAGRFVYVVPKGHFPSSTQTKSLIKGDMKWADAVEKMKTTILHNTGISGVDFYVVNFKEENKYEI